MKINHKRYFTLLVLLSLSIKVLSIDIESIPKTKSIWTDHTLEIYHDFQLLEAFRPINQGLCQVNNSDYENWINLNTLADPITKEMPTSYDSNNYSDDIFNLGYKSNINDRNCGVFEDNFFNVIKASQTSDDSSLLINSYKVRDSLSDSRFQLEITEDISEANPYGVLKYDLNIYGLLNNNGLYLAHAESKYDDAKENVIVDSITWVDAVIINQNLTPGTVSETYRARIIHDIGESGYGTIVGMTQGGFDAQVTLPTPHGSFPDGIPDSITTTNFAYNDNYLLFNKSTSSFPGSPYNGQYVQSQTYETGESCIDRKNFWSYVPSFGYGVYDSNGDRLSGTEIRVAYNDLSIGLTGTNISIEYVCKDMSDGSVAPPSSCLDGGGEGNKYQSIPVIDIPDKTLVQDSEGNEYYIRVLKARKVYAYQDLIQCEGLSLRDSIDTPDHKTFVYLNEKNIPPSGAILYNQYESGDTIDAQYLGKVFIANNDDDGDMVLNFLDAFPEDPSKTTDHDYDLIDDSEDTDIQQKVMTWIKHLNKDIFEIKTDQGN